MRFYIKFLLSAVWMAGVTSHSEMTPEFILNSEKLDKNQVAELFSKENYPSNERILIKFLEREIFDHLGKLNVDRENPKQLAALDAG